VISPSQSAGLTPREKGQAGVPIREISKPTIREICRTDDSSIRAIARSTGLSRNTVRRYLRGGDEVAVRKTPAKRAEKLDPF
jgi:transposase